MKKRLIALLIAVITVFTMVVPVLAATEEEVAGTYTATRVYDESTDYDPEDDHLVLNADGTGYIYFVGEKRIINWAVDSTNHFYALDFESYALDGTYSDGKITALYGNKYNYVFEKTAEASASADTTAETQPADTSASDATAPSESAGEATEPTSAEEINSSDAAGYYPVTDGNVGEYLILNADGTGATMRNRCGWTFDWTLDADGTFKFIDHKSYRFEGTLMDGVIQGTLTGPDSLTHTYIYSKSDATAPIMSLCPERWAADLPHVFDQADILSADEEASLTEDADALTEKHNTDFYIVVVDDMNNYNGNRSVETLAEELRAGYKMGYSHDKNMIMILMSMADRDYDLFTFGDRANEACNQYGRGYLEDCFLDNFKKNDWAGGFEDFLDGCDYLLKRDSEGNTYNKDSENAGLKIAIRIIVGLLLGFILAKIISNIVRKKMKTAQKKTEANAYLDAS
ncbi:MAG: TPM domain-containing protein, partial [Parasporobacterium sp.]|nr:TPM domain-containing protein [Parasporobacterium sp.]